MHSLRLAAFLLFCLSATACYEPVPEAQLELNLRKMAEIVADIHVAESALSEMPMGPKRDSSSAAYYLQIFESHDIKPAVFDENLKRVLRDPQQSLEMYTLALEVMEMQEAELR